ncbi:hypothetical protein TWF106_010695 [Orbilia oligospora]|uniref:Uncharacterized protein n=1 Tax=Orbilia oligospora TaxID=2813651 RepID=A0A7C8QF38_ORBOL|nr:hypothetical protein TWF106_010695 [Orbilia oligospora]
MGKSVEDLSYELIHSVVQFLDPSPQSGILALPYNRFALARTSRTLYYIIWNRYAIHGGIEAYLALSAMEFPPGVDRPLKRESMSVLWRPRSGRKNNRVLKTQSRQLMNEPQVFLPTITSPKLEGTFEDDFLDRGGDSIVMHYVTDTRWIILLTDQMGVSWILWGTWSCTNRQRRTYAYETAVLKPKCGDPWVRWSQLFDNVLLMDYQSCGDLPLSVQKLSSRPN